MTSALGGSKSPHDHNFWVAYREFPPPLTARSDDEMYVTSAFTEMQMHKAYEWLSAEL